jgi:hypothetical protein
MVHGFTSTSENQWLTLVQAVGMGRLVAAPAANNARSKRLHQHLSTLCPEIQHM